MIRRLFIVAGTVLTLAAASAAGALTTEVANVKYDNAAQVGSSRLHLNGAGIRCEAVFQVCTAGLYLAGRAATPEAVLASPDAKRMHIVMLREIDANELGKLFARGGSAPRRPTGS